MRNLTQSSRFHGFGGYPLLLISAVFLSLFSGCAVPPAEHAKSEVEVITTATDTFEQMANEGRFLDAALGYSRLAANAIPPQRERYALRAAELLMTGNYVPQSFQMLMEMDPTNLGPDLQARHAILSARIALARVLPDDALAALDKAASLLPPEDLLLRQSLHRLRATAFEQSGNHLEAARERVILEPLLTDPEAIETNQQAILKTLQALSPAALQSLQTIGPPDVLSGWLELTAISMSVAESGQGNTALARWRERYPQHPALDTILSTVLALRPQALPLPKQIALILPQHNRFAKAANAVRDGFLAAYYAQDNQNQAVSGTFDAPTSFVPTIRFYDEGDDPNLIELVYEQAMDDGAEFVVGPLDKDAVDRLATREDLPVPVLALNYSESHRDRPDRPASNNLFQISLSPEQEAQQVAERAWLDGHSRAAIITPDTSWGERVAKAFSERWLQFGGKVVEKQNYDPNKNDYSLPIRRLLNVDESEDRNKELRRIVGKKMEFIPRRRQDVDFIFMAAASRQARLIRPQLRFHHAAKVPVYATSHSYDGTINANMDRDMDDVIFADMPWTLNTDNPLKAEIEQLWPNETKRYSRLYAMGVDAYQLIGQLNFLRRNRAEFYQGETGDLYLDTANRIQRRLVWAKFQNGIPQRLSEF